MAMNRNGEQHTAADIMTPAPRNGSKYSTVLEVAMIMRDEDCGVVPIVEEGKPLGVVTDRDIALAICDHPNLASLPASEIMSKDLVTTHPDATLGEVRDKLADHAVRRILVVDEADTLLGIISWADLSPALPDQTLGRVVSDVVEQPA
jgi:CBS domain-containing protein